MLPRFWDVHINFFMNESTVDEDLSNCLHHRESLPTRPKSATVRRPHEFSVGPRGFTGASGVSHIFGSDACTAFARYHGYHGCD